MGFRVQRLGFTGLGLRVVESREVVLEVQQGQAASRCLDTVNEADVTPSLSASYVVFVVLYMQS